MATTYKIMRFYEKGEKRVVERGLSLEDAQAHYKDPETNSRTATSATAKARTRRMGPWFDGFTKEKGG